MPLSHGLAGLAAIKAGAKLAMLARRGSHENRLRSQALNKFPGRQDKRKKKPGAAKLRPAFVK